VIDAQLKAGERSPQLASVIAERVQRSLGYPYPVQTRFVAAIDWGASWKQENFAVSDAPPPDASAT
jgi:hypothetical protein